MIRAKYVAVETASGKRAAERWKAMYCKGGQWALHTGRREPEAAYQELVALGDDPPIAEVARIVGNQSWSYLGCDGCGDYVERAVRIGSETSETHLYCATCISEAAMIMEKNRIIAAARNVLGGGKETDDGR